MAIGKQMSAGGEGVWLCLMAILIPIILVSIIFGLLAQNSLNAQTHQQSQNNSSYEKESK